MNIILYLEEIKQKYKQGNATEHSYRPVFEQFLKSLYPENILITNEPKRQKCGAPDFILSKLLRNVEIPLGYIETKDVGKNLNELIKSDQLERYKNSLDNLIFTDYLDFIFFKNGKEYERIQIAEIIDDEICNLENNFERFITLLENFISFQGQNIKSAKTLASIMAKKAKLIKYAFHKALISEHQNGIKDQLSAFKKILIHDIDEERFANIYAQTITYGLFTARLHDTTLEDFSRVESYDLIPKSNPFLRQLFRYIAIDLEEESRWSVDELCEVFRCTNIYDILNDFGKSTGRNDPIVHFYEDFLKEFDSEVRKARGVWYTPEPVVNFIVRAIDEVLKTHFNLKDGIADNSKIKIKRDVSQSSDKRTKSGKASEEIEIHKVQLLDIATGTGTFSAEVIKQIYQNYYQGQEGMWSSYVEQDLLPRLHGFEILMASYAMCHLKIDLLLKETGYLPSNQDKQPRLGVYLTNALEESHQDYDTLFASFLSNEAKEAARIKKETPVMVVFGNPPYSGISQNNGEWIINKIEDYKYINGIHFGERKHWLQDDYVKFIRLGEHYINKNGDGILAYITSNGYLDNPTFRGMRWHLLNTFDHIYIIDLHGSLKRKKIAPDGKKDENVFDIMQGVSIIIAVKTKGNKNKLSKVHHVGFYGRRKEKYQKLWENNLKSLEFREVKYSQPHYFFLPKDFDSQAKYEKGFKVDKLFSVNVTGIVTARDNFVIDISKANLIKRIKEFSDDNQSDDEIRKKFFHNKKNGKYLAGDSRGWKLSEARKKIQRFKHSDIVKRISYRLFDDRFIYYHNSMIDWGREKFMHHFIKKKNIGIDLCRQLVSENYSHIFITDKIVDDSFVSNKSKERGYVFPLYLYSQENILDNKARNPNLNPEIIKEISKKLDLKFIEDHELSEAESKDNFSPLDLLDYIYSILHSPTYREKYKEFLKIDFPRVPYPDNQEAFWQLVDLGGQIRKLHLMEGEKFDGIKGLITKYPVAGSNKVETINAKSFIINPENPDLGKVHINKDQYFDNVPVIAWEFYIGGYQPAQKWLKDRKDRELSNDDILHYQKIILALNETDKLMKEIDETCKF